jgi:hypothetical protein
VTVHWNRDEPQFFNAYALPWRTIDDIEVARGVPGRLISADEASDSSTTMVQLPPSWRAVDSADTATLEMFVLEGDVTVGDQTVGAGGFIALPRGRGGATLSTSRGAHLFVFRNPDLPVDAYYPDKAIHATHVWQESWIATVMPGMLHGVMHKSLRYPDPTGGLFHGGPGGMIRFIIMTPGFAEPRQEVHHDCWEEIIFLSGDFFMPHRGLHARGTVLNNPAELRHGGLTTQKGTAMLLHCAAPMGAEYFPVSDGPAMAEQYLENASWLADDIHRDWHDCVEYHIDSRSPVGA